MKRTLRVAFLSEHASPLALLGGEDAGGQNVYVDEVSRSLGQQGLQVDIFTRCGEADAPEVVEWAPGVRVINVRVGPPHFLFKDQLWPLMPDFRNAIVRFKEQHNLRYDIIHSNFWMSGWVAAELGQRFNIPVVHIFHALGQTKQRLQGAADTSPARRIEIEREVIRRVDRLIAQCPSEESELIQDYQAHPAQITLIPSAVNVHQFRPIPQRRARHPLGLGSDEFVIVYVGRMVPRKDVGNIVRAIALLPDSPKLPPVRFLVVGGESADPDPTLTPEIGAVQELAAAFHISDKLIFTGCVPPHQLSHYYSAGDVAVTTPWYEPFGLTPLEAMACGRAVIGSAVGGITFTVQDGVTGFLVPPRQPHALARRLQQLRCDRPLAQRLGEAARRHVCEQFTWDKVGQRVAQLYQAVLSSKPWQVQVPVVTLRPRLVTATTPISAD